MASIKSGIFAFKYKVKELNNQHFNATNWG